MTEVAVTDKICKSCPMRRDSTPACKDYSVGDPAIWYGCSFWPNWNLYQCERDPDKVCLGAIIHVVNMSAWMNILDPMLKASCLEYSPNHELIFSGNNEFIRYHRGEDFGSLEWFRRSASYKHSMSIKVKEADLPDGQADLFKNR